MIIVTSLDDLELTSCDGFVFKESKNWHSVLDIYLNSLCENKNCLKT